MRVLLALTMLSMGPVATAAASDFWDDVRRPGRAAARALGRDARRALSQGLHDEALSMARRMVSLDDAGPDNHVLLGRVLSAMSHHAEAAGAFAQALDRSSRALDHPAHGQRAALSACIAGDFELAETILRRLVSHAPAGPQRGGLFALQGDVLLALGPASLGAAMIAYEHALHETAAPGPMLELALSLSLLRAGHVDEALGRVRGGARGGQLRETVMHLPLPATERYARLALLLSAHGKDDAARNAWKVATESGPWAQADRARLESAP